MKNNIVFVFKTLFSSVKAHETGRDHRDYWITVSLMVISAKKGSNFHSSARRYFLQGQPPNSRKRRPAYGFPLSFHVWNSQGWIQKGLHFAAGTRAWEGQGPPLLASALNSKSAVSMARALLMQVALDLTASLLTFTDNWKGKSKEKAVCQTRLWLPQLQHCKDKNTAEHYMFKFIALTSHLNKYKQK